MREGITLHSTQDLKNDHIIVRRLRHIAERCSDKLYANENVPIEDIEIISVVIEEFVDSFHQHKEEQAYFPTTKDKNGFGEEIRKFLIEHELGRRIGIMLRRKLDLWTQKRNEKKEEHEAATDDLKRKEPVARFLKSYAVYLSDHTAKEDRFFDLLEEKGSISAKEDAMLLEHYAACKNHAGGKARVEQMIRLIEYLEKTQWMEERCN